MIAKYAPRLAWPSSVFKPARDLAAGTDSAFGSLPLVRYLARTFLVLSFDSCTLGWSNGSMPRTDPAIELVAQRQGDHRLARLLERLHCFVGWIRVHADVHEQPVVAVHRRPAQRFALDGHDPLALLARALGDQLLHPVAESRDPGRRDERQLVAALQSELAHDAAQPHARVVCGGHGIRARVRHLDGALEQLGHVDAHQGPWD